MIRRTFLVLLLLGILTLHPVGAQLLSLGPQIVVASSGELDFVCPRIVGRADRSFVVVWQASGPSIMAQRFDTAGASVGGPIDVDQGQLRGRTLSSLFIENRPGQVDVVVWSSITANDPATLRFHRRILSEPAPAAIRAPSYVRKVFPRRIGGYLAAWPTQKGSGWAIAPLDEAGHLAGHAIRATTTAPADPNYFEVTQGADGSLAVYWYTSSSPSRLYIRRFNRNLQSVGLSRAVQETDPAPGGTQIAIAPDGRNSVVAWVNYDTAVLTGTIRIRFFAADGTPLSDPLDVATPSDPPVNAFHPEAIALDHRGRALVVWNLVKDETGTDSHSVQVWTPGGSISDPQDLTTGPVLFTFPCADAAAAGRTFVVVWHAMLDTGESAIFARRFLSPD